MKPDLAVASFDLAWSGDTGWAVLCWNGRYTDARSGVIHLPAFSDEVGKAKNAGRLVDAVAEVLLSLPLAHRVVVCYESSLTWLLAAARDGKKTRKPVTRDSLMASAFSVTCFWIALAGWLRTGVEPKVVPVDAQMARRRLGADKAGMTHRVLVREAMDMPEYGKDRVKAGVGAAVAVRMQHEGFGLTLPPTDDEADALCAAFAVADAELLLMRAET